MAARKGRSKGKGRKRSRRIKSSITPNQIVQEIVDALTKSITDAGLMLSVGALDEWRAKLLVSVTKNLNKGAVWTPLARQNVLRVAKDMGTIAVILSAADSEVTKNRVHAAFRAAKFHKSCPGTAGSGAWCDFSI